MIQKEWKGMWIDISNDNLHQDHMQKSHQQLCQSSIKMALIMFSIEEQHNLLHFLLSFWR